MCNILILSAIPAEARNTYKITQERSVGEILVKHNEFMWDTWETHKIFEIFIEEENTANLY